MDPSEGPVEPKERRKIQFAVPPTEPTQLDPRQVEMIRRRRPTPATLFKVADQTSPEDDISTHQWVVGENGVLKPKRINPNIYQPPSLKAVQQMAEAHMQKLGVYPHVEEEGEEPIQRGGEELSSSCTPGNLNITSQMNPPHMHVTLSILYFSFLSFNLKRLLLHDHNSKRNVCSHFLKYYIKLILLNTFYYYNY
uniref:Protein phosphatase 1 regulatory subunit 1B n=1 Tax=Cyprinus carpio TaxID=7962 RepID=A0A8C1MUD7_CYPCA